MEEAPVVIAEEQDPGESKDRFNPIPERFRVISGSVLKVIACVTMLIDHIGEHYWLRHDVTLFLRSGRPYTLYMLARTIGRLAFPLFCFLIVEGFVHTHSRYRYGRNLLLFALVSEIPWNLVHNGEVFFVRSQNVFFTLFFGFLGMCTIQYMRDKPQKMGLLLLGLMVASYTMNCDYGLTGFGFLIMLYLLRNTRAFQAVVGCCFLTTLWQSGAAFVPILFYNGERGFIRGKWKYTFYAFYPVHLLVLFVIKYDFFSYMK